jgi:Holliday junction resolvase RusA-like endonuclease
MPWTASEPIRIIVAGPPKPWKRAGHRIVTTRDRRQFVSTYTPADQRKEQTSIKQIASLVMGNRPPLDGAIELRVVAYMPVPASWSQRKQAAALADQVRPTGRPDFDNLAKGLADSFKGIVWRDDTLVTEASVWKRFSDRPRIVAEVRLLTWT